MPALKITAILIMFSVLTGCARYYQVKDMVTSFEVGNKTYELDMDRKDINSMEKNLAENIYPMDTRLTLLLRRISSVDSYPSQGWSQKTLEDFFWLNGLVIMDQEEGMLLKKPAQGIKKLQYSPLLEQALELEHGQTALKMQDTPLGKEIFIFSAVYDNFQPQGFVAVHFDPRTFISQSRRPEDIVLICCSRVVWPGRFKEYDDRLSEINWEEKLAQKTSGKISVKDQTFFWFARAAGQSWMVYLITES